MDTTLVLTRTAKGVLEAKNEDGKLNYDAVRLLRMVNGKATIGELRTQFSDLSEIRFQKALTTLEEKGLVRALAANSPNPGERLEIPRLDRQIQELGQEFMRSLDFTSLERQLLEAMRSSPSQAAAPATAPEPPVAPRQDAASAVGAEHKTGIQMARNAIEAQLRAELLPVLRPRIEEELRRILTATLRPKLEEELRRQLVVVLRPALEAEIRTKLTAALKPRVELELRARLESQAANPARRDGAASPPAAASSETSNLTVAVTTGPDLRLLECIRETVFQTDLDGTSVYMNERWARLTGYSREETLGQPLCRFFVPQDRDGVAEHLDGVARGGAVPVVFEARLVRKTGTPLRVAIRVAPYTTSTGAIAGVCGTLRGMRETPAT